MIAKAFSQVLQTSHIELFVFCLVGSICLFSSHTSLCLYNLIFPANIIAQTMNFPDVFVLNDLIRKICNRRDGALFAREALECWNYIMATWDIGAKRTFWAYYYKNESAGQKFLLHYYMDYFDDVHEVWTCSNPSAAAVHTMRTVHWLA